MNRMIAFLLVALTLLPWGMASAQRMYKWIDSQGNVSYHDRPPPADSGYRVEEPKLKQRRGGGEPAADAAERSPVVLYVVPRCAPCDLARAHLQKRNVPFSEKNVENDPRLQGELKAKVGALSVPAITIGTKVLNSYSEGWLDSELDNAGYSEAEAEQPAEQAPAREETGYKAPTR